MHHIHLSTLHVAVKNIHEQYPYFLSFYSNFSYNISGDFYAVSSEIYTYSFRRYVGRRKYYHILL